jgi:peptide/nickel transport system substrate-binding protein
MYGKRRTRLLIGGAAALLVVVVVVIVLAVTGGDDGEQATREASAQDRTLRIAIAGDVETLDSDFSRFQRANEVNLNTQGQFFSYGTREGGEGYVLYDPKKILGGSVESWKLSPDRKTIDLNIRRGQKFPKTGNPVTADDFIYWFDRAQGTKSGYLFNVNTAGITKWQKTGRYSVRLTFERPSPFFFFLFRDQSQAPVDSVEMKKQATADDKWSTKWKANHDAANGEYFVERQTEGVEMVLRRNPGYWSKPFFDRVVLRVSPSAANRALLLQRGTVDIATELSSDDLDSLRNAEGVKVLSIPSRNQYHFGFNTKRKPFTSTKVRQALSYAVPYDEIKNDVLRGRAQIPQSPVARQGQGFDGSGWPYKYDLNRAKQLLGEAGYANGFSFRLGVSSDDPIVEELAILLKDRFRRIGVNMRIDKQSAAVFAERLEKRQSDAWLRSLLWFVDDPGYVGQTFYQCGALLNWMDFCDRRIDRVIKRVVDTPIEEGDERQQAAAEMQRLLSEAAPTLILAEPNFELAMREDIEGYVHLPDHLLLYSALQRGDGDGV